MRAQMDSFGQSDMGRLRSTNEDHFLVADLNKSLRVHGTSLKLDDEARIYGGSQGKLLVVADGMGGEAEGERAEHNCGRSVGGVCAEQSWVVFSPRREH